MKFKVFEEGMQEFYPTYVEWSKGHNFPTREMEEIDEVYVCYNGDTPIYSCFFWRTPSTFAVIGFPFSNPNVSYEQKKGGLSFLFEKMLSTAKKKGFKIVWTTSDTERVEEVLKGQGFVQGDLRVNQYVKIL